MDHFLQSTNKKVLFVVLHREQTVVKEVLGLPPHSPSVMGHPLSTHWLPTVLYLLLKDFLSLFLLWTRDGFRSSCTRQLRYHVKTTRETKNPRKAPFLSYGLSQVPGT